MNISPQAKSAFEFATTLNRQFEAIERKRLDIELVMKEVTNLLQLSRLIAKNIEDEINLLTGMTDGDGQFPPA